MSFRRSVIGLLGAAVLAVAACSGTASSGVPSLALPSITIPSGALPSIALEGFCAEFASKLETSWPNIDASTATALVPVVSQWASKPEMASVAADVATLGVWISAAATAGSVSSPPPDVMTAFDHLKAFADTNC
jgi:hypothetical protein